MNISDFAFAGCQDLANVTIGSGIVSIGSFAFLGTALTEITFPASVTNVEEGAFQQCFDLSGFYFQGNAPTFDPAAYPGTSAVAYYLPWTSGWGPTLGGFLGYGGIPTETGSLQLIAVRAGIRTNEFGFTMVWTNNPVVIVQACSNLNNPAWLPISTNTLTAGVAYFNDPQWAQYSSRYYRVVPQ
jgi:hypothetical protein